VKAVVCEKKASGLLNVCSNRFNHYLPTMQQVRTAFRFYDAFNREREGRYAILALIVAQSVRVTVRVRV